jgi:Transposase IS66 family
VQAPLPSLPIERGRPGPGLLAHAAVAKYADGLPLHRQSGIYAREGLKPQWIPATASISRDIDANQAHISPAARTCRPTGRLRQPEAGAAGAARGDCDSDIFVAG